MCRQFEYLILSIAITCTLAAAQQRPARTATSLPQTQQAPLTDRDVIQMVESGKPEAAIVATIRSSRTNFDLSPQGCSLLAAAHVSRTILNAMGSGSQPPCASTSELSKPQTSGTGTLLGNGNAMLLGGGSKQTQPTAAAPSRGGDRVALNPQPLPPGPATKSGAGSPGANVAQATAAVSDYRQPPGNRESAKTHALRPVKLAPAKALRKVTNSLVGKQNVTIIAVLQQQRQAADQEASAMKLGVRSAGSAGTTTVSSRETAPSRKLQVTAGSPQLGPERTQGAPGPSGFQIVNKPYAEPPSIACAKDPTPRVLSAPSVFTPEARYNLFTISGCGFGATAAGNTAYIFGGNGFRENLAIDFWSDRGITAHLDPALAGALDQNNITLVVAPAGRQAFQKSGFKFYAARGMPAPDGSDQEVQLAYNSMPQSSVTLFDATPVFAGYDRVPQNGTSQFPSFSFQGTPVAGWVFRYAYGHDDTFNSFNGDRDIRTCFINDVTYRGKLVDGSNACAKYFEGGQKFGADTWDFSKLAPGFSISSYQLYYEDTDSRQLCGAWDETGHQNGLLGSWDFNLTTSSQITVTWPVYWCRDTEATPSDRVNKQEQSAYGLAVWVLGPRCVDPWTGQKDQTCMAKVQKILGS